MQNNGENEPRHEGETVLGYQRSTSRFSLGFHPNNSLFRFVKLEPHVIEYYISVLNGLLHIFVLCFRIQKRIGCRNAALDAYEVSSFYLLCVNADDILFKNWEYSTVLRMFGYVCCSIIFRMILPFISYVCVNNIKLALHLLAPWFTT